jgi:hypothetical protein
VLIGKHDEGTSSMNGSHDYPLDHEITKQIWSMSNPQTMSHPFLDSWLFAQPWASTHVLILSGFITCNYV